MAKTKKQTGEVLVKEILDPNTNPDNRIINNKAQLKKVIRALKQVGYRIVLTQGVWDLIHEGHAQYLAKAKSHGDILVVGVDSDALTRARKGPKRPIVPEGERIRMISHLRHADIITTRSDKEDIGALIRLIEPDVLVVSTSTKDFSKKMKNEYKGVCGKVVDLNPQATTSTTSRVTRLSIEGAEDLAKHVNDLVQKFMDDLKK